MAWERSFEKRVLTIREKELKYQKLNYTIEVFRSLIASDLGSQSVPRLDPLERHLERLPNPCHSCFILALRRL